MRKLPGDSPAIALAKINHVSHKVLGDKNKPYLRYSFTDSGMVPGLGICQRGQQHGVDDLIAAQGIVANLGHLGGSASWNRWAKLTHIDTLQHAAASTEVWDFLVRTQSLGPPKE